MMIDVFSIMNAIGLLAFATVGALKAIDDDLDLLGVIVLGVVTALGGGTIRDLLVNRVPQSLQSTTDMSVAVIGVFLALCGVWFAESLADHVIVLVPDAIGLSAFTTTGVLVGYATGVSQFGMIILATVTAVGGGAIADLLRGKPPFVLREDFYASCAILGGIAFWLAVTAGLTRQISAIACATVVLLFRLCAIHQEWQLPTMSRVLTPSSANYSVGSVDDD
jgi:uncharacterized membrane protein YeiH